MSHPRAEERITTRVIQDEVEWDAIADAWNGLYAVSPAASPPLDDAWLKHWWRVYRPATPASLRIVTVWQGATLVGALPLYLQRDARGVFGTRILRALSTGEDEAEETCPDYLNLLSRTGAEVACARRVWQEIERLEWDRFEIPNVADAALLLRGDVVPSDMRPVSMGTCPVADLTGGFEAYLQRLSPNSRQQARRLIREGDRAGARLEIVDAHRLAGAFSDLIRLHEARWTRQGSPGVFAAPRFVEFHRRLLAEWLPGGRAVLARLVLDSGPVAVLYGFVTGAKFHFYQSGVQVEPAGPLRSPGNLAHLLLMESLIERGVTEYDFLRGSASYKKRLATRENRMAGIDIWRRTPRAAIHRSTRVAGAVVKKTFRFLRPSPSARKTFSLFVL